MQVSGRLNANQTTQASIISAAEERKEERSYCSVNSLTSLARIFLIWAIATSQYTKYQNYYYLGGNCMHLRSAMCVMTMAGCKSNLIAYAAVARGACAGRGFQLPPPPDPLFHNFGASKSVTRCS